mmetsp:Transcript_9899/g.17805  ORF Transcript_9899/g.17805 Transcript_9899/m.17805 type:complete len:634 (-) Transcript_9899:55-1956(-)
MKINAITVLTIVALHHDVTSSSRIEPNLFQLRIPSLISRNSSPFNAFCSSPLCFQNHVTARKRNVHFTGNTRPFAAKQNWDNSNNEFQVGSTQSNEPKPKGGAKARLARATASLIAQRKKEESLNHNDNPSELSFSSASSNKMQRSPSYADDDYYGDDNDDDKSSYDLINLTKKIDQKILANNWNRSGQRRRVNDKKPGKEVHVQHETDSMQSLLGYNHFEGEWSDRNSTTKHVAICFGKPLIRDQVTIEYATRIRTLAKMLKEEPLFRPSLICFTGGVSGGNSISDASAGYVYFRHLCNSQNIVIDDAQTKVWVDDTKGCSNEREAMESRREAMESIASELWRNYIKQWLNERPLTERLNQHYGVGWTILERRVDIHFTLVSTEYHLCNLNDVHHRSPGKSFLQPLVSLRGLVGSDRYKDDLEVMDPSYSSSVNVRNSNSFGGIENSVDTSWSFQYGTYPFLHGNEDAIVFLGQCFLLGEELTPLLVNMKGVVEQTEFFQRDNYLLLSSIRRSLVSLVEALYTDKGQEIRAGVIKYFEESGRNQITKEDVKIIVMLESALLNLGRCIDLVKPAGLLVSSVPAATWSKALFNLEESMSRIKTVCDPDQPLEAVQWGKLFDDENVTSEEDSSYS